MQEATPDVMTPMCWSMWTSLGELAARRAWHSLGILPRSMVYLPTDVNEFVMAPFYGRQALNVDRLAALMGALPGTSREDVERDMLGTVRADRPDDRAPRGRLPFILVKAPRVLLAQDRRVRRLCADQWRWWTREVLPGDERSGRRLLTESRERLLAAATVHGSCRFLTQALQGAIGGLAASAGMPESASTLYSGFGGVAETAIAEDLWALSRDQLTEAEFVRRHGYHGHQVGNVHGVPWRIDLAPVRSVVAALGARADSARPRLRERAAIARRRQAETDLRAALPPAERWMLTRLTGAAAVQVRCMERSKAAFLMAIDGARAACVGLGAELAAEGRLHHPGDALFLTADELVGTLPGDSAELAPHRRSRWNEYRSLTLPTTFVGMPEPVTTGPVPETAAGPVRETAGGPGRNDGRVLPGACGSAGTVTGRARVILDLSDAGSLEPGEVLVCRHTDPAWVMAMTLAEALVVDVGASSSHGAIVARELGIPCVIGTGHGTRMIRTGDRVLVDGTAGRVEILEPP
jgi:pyruvate,water dikinase